MPEIKKTKKNITEKKSRQEPCPSYCPFLQKEAFYCRLFNTSLQTQPPIIFKCAQCLNSDTRKSTYKAKIKDFEKRVYMWDKASKRKPLDLWGKIKVTLSDWKDRKSFKEFLMSLAGDLPILLDSKMSRLLLNLYLVLDSTEKQIMKDILVNPQTAEILIKKIKTVGKNPNLLKQVRKEMDDEKKCLK